MYSIKRTKKIGKDYCNLIFKYGERDMLFYTDTGTRRYCPASVVIERGNTRHEVDNLDDHGWYSVLSCGRNWFRDRFVPLDWKEFQKATHFSNNSIGYIEYPKKTSLR
jgi:hypothetical protein